jgi:hypothetical protein
MTWAGAVKDVYPPYWLTSVWADYQGADGATGFPVNYNLNGTVKTMAPGFAEPAANTFSLPESAYSTASVTPQNAHQTLPLQAGKYYALKFARDLMGGNLKYVNKMTVNSPSESHTGAQGTFLRSSYNGAPIGMLIEGGWWYNEASKVMNDMAEEYDPKYSAMNRRFGIMPTPKADDGSSAGGRTWAPYTAQGRAAISKYTKIPELAKDFFKFLHSDEVLRIFTVKSGVMRPYDYELTDEQLTQVPYYTRNMLAAKKDSAYIFKGFSPDRTVRQNNYTRLAFGWEFHSRLSGPRDVVSPTTEFFSYADLSAKDYFNGLLTMQTANGPLVA